MDDDNMAVNDTDGEEAIADNTPLSEEQAPEEDQLLESEVATEDDGFEAETVEESREQKKGAAARIKELNAQKKAAEEKAQSLEERLREVTTVGRFTGQTPQLDQQLQPREDELNADGSVNADAFRKRVLAEARNESELMIRQAEAISRINSESSDVLRAYPELDPESDVFNKELSDAVTEAVENGVRANPYSASPKQIANRMMKPYKEAVAKEAGQASERVAKQVSRAALRPTSVKQSEKTAAEKSIEELEQELGVVHS